jgi:hypothetical protein
MSIRETSRVQKTTTAVVPETVKGQIAYPSASHGLLTVGRPTFTAQVGELEDTGWLLGTRTKQPGCTKNFKAEAFGINVYLTRSGTAGTVTNEHNVLEGCWGEATVNAGTDVQYDPAFDRKTYSIWISHEHTMFVLTGAVFTGWTVKVSPSDTCKLQLDATGLYARQHVIGSGVLTGSVAAGGTVVSVSAEHAARFSGMGLVCLETAAGVVDDNAGAGYQIASVDHTAGTITISSGTGSAFAAGDFIKPFLPEYTPNSSPIDAKQLEVLADGDAFDVYSITIKGTENIVYSKQLTLYPERFDEDKNRSVDLTIMGLMIPETAEFYRSINEQTVMTIQSKSTVEGGSKIKFNLYDVRISSVQPGEEGPTMNVTITGSLRGAREDEYNFVLS